MKLKQKSGKGIKRYGMILPRTGINAAKDMEDTNGFKYCIFVASIEFSVMGARLVRQYTLIEGDKIRVSAQTSHWFPSCRRFAFFYIDERLGRNFNVDKLEPSTENDRSELVFLEFEKITAIPLKPHHIGDAESLMRCEMERNNTGSNASRCMLFASSRLLSFWKPRRMWTIERDTFFDSKSTTHMPCCYLRGHNRSLSVCTLPRAS